MNEKNLTQPQLIKCPKCGNEMELGMTIEYKNPGGIEININSPKNETWGKDIKPGFFLNSVRKEIPIVTYRCLACGFLESYAKEDIQLS